MNSEKMTDIFDIKDVVLGIPINVFYSLIFIIFLIVLFILYKYLLNNKKEKNKQNIEKIIMKENPKDFNKILDNFEEKYLEIDEKIFYSKLLSILREILETKGNKNISKMTFEEINNLNLDNNIISLIQSIYYKEYTKQIEDSEKIRQNLIENIRKLV